VKILHETQSVLTQPAWVERSKVKQEQCFLNTKAFSRGKLKVEDDHGQIVCTLERGKKWREKGKWWLDVLNWAEIES